MSANYPGNFPPRQTTPEPAAGEAPELQPRLARTPRGPKPVVTYGLIIVTVMVFALQMASQMWSGEDIPAILGMKVNPLIVAGQLWRLITPVLLHGSFLHIALNMYGLYVFGPALERSYGKGRFLTLYLLGAFAGNTLSFLFSPNPSLGSSTAIFGLIGAEGVFFYRNRALLGARARQELSNIVFLALFNLALGFAGSARIDNWGHIGGLLGGFLFAWFGGPVLRLEGIYPSIRLVDERDSSDGVRAGLAVFVVFASLAAAGIFLRGV